MTIQAANKYQVTCLQKMTLTDLSRIQQVLWSAKKFGTFNISRQKGSDTGEEKKQNWVICQFIADWHGIK